MTKKALDSLGLSFFTLTLSSGTLWLAIFTGGSIIGYDSSFAFAVVMVPFFIATYIVLSAIERITSLLLRHDNGSHHPKRWTAALISMISAASIPYSFLTLKGECVSCAGNGSDFVMYTVLIGTIHAIAHLKLRELVDWLEELTRLEFSKKKRLVANFR
jgi:hypothetical protein